MADNVANEIRSRVMSHIRGKNTKPEMIIRSGLHKLGYRFRLHHKKLPGKPDIVLPRYNVIILVNGCFWHGHNCPLFRLPGTRTSFWKKKIEDTRLRDSKNITEYKKLGWRVLVVWECAIRGKDDTELASLINKCDRWIQSTSKHKSFQSKAV